ncbi:MAG TPA: Gfo/Idh/MocA family oxidoreductase [Sumerlaeia bacterium]|nr:Gfo/Idh/MocA family oxidoreductase [Sumerlaeia bacterium]
MSKKQNRGDTPDCRKAKDPRRVRIAMVGAGEMANRFHYPSLASFEDVEIVGVCDVDRQRLNATARKYGIKNRYADYAKMIGEQEPDGVYVIGQPHFVYDVWMGCLSQGQNLCIEKPMGLTIHQARSLAHLAEQNRCITQVIFQRRSCPLLVKLRNECLKRGPITHALCRFYKCEIEPRFDARDHVMDDTVHSIDTLRWTCGGEVIDIESHVRRVGVPDINFVSATLHFDNGSVGYLINSWSSGRRIFDVEMHAPGVCAEVDIEEKGAIYADGDTAGVTYDTRDVAGSDAFHVYAGFQAKNREFIDALKKAALPESNFSDALKTMEVAEKILAQATLLDL